MKKQLSLASKRKWVTGGILAFSAVSLLTTGFATWVVGVQRTKEEGVIGVTVDTAENQFVKIDATLSEGDKTIKLAETAPANGPIVTSTATDGDLQVTFSELKVTIGKDYDWDNHFTGIKFEFIDALNGNTTKHEGVDLLSDDPVGKTSPAAIEMTRPNNEYIVLWDDETFTKDDFDESGNYLVKDFSGEFNFAYGGFFNGAASPATYYNNTVKKEVIDACTNEQLSTIVDDVYSELDAMHTYFTTHNELFVRVSLVAK